MSCGCSDGGNSEYNNYCNADTPYPQVSNESVPSLINNLTLAIYGSYTKSVDQATGRIVWDVPCTPQTSPIGGLEPLEGEGMLCYVSRALNTLFPTVEPFVTLDGIQTLTNKTLVSPVIIGTINADTIYATNNNGSTFTADESIVLKNAGGPGAVLDYGNNAFSVVNSNGGGVCLIANTVGDVGLGGGSTNVGANAVKSRLHVVSSTISGGVPLTNGSAYDPNCIMRLQPGTTALDVGIRADKAMWVQPRLSTNYATNYGISLCPNGGDITLAAGGGAVSIAPTGSGAVSIAAGSGAVSIASGGGTVSIASGGGLATISPAGNVTLCSSSGFVGIGKSPDASYKVDVQGSLRTTLGIACGSVTCSQVNSKNTPKFVLGGVLSTAPANNVYSVFGGSFERTAAGTYSVAFSGAMFSNSVYPIIVSLSQRSGSPPSYNVGHQIISRTANGFTIKIYAASSAADLDLYLGITVYDLD